MLSREFQGVELASVNDSIAWQDQKVSLPVHGVVTNDKSMPTPTGQIIAALALAHLPTREHTSQAADINRLPEEPGEPPVGKGDYAGYLDKVECGTIRGWTWDASLPNNPVTVEFLADGQPIGAAPANLYRSDLKDAGKGNGVHSYRFPTPELLKMVSPTSSVPKSRTHPTR